MKHWAAIDLMEGRVVTLVQGRPEEKTVWKGRPLDFASRWQAEGADGIHVVDLDAAFGTGSNDELVSKLVDMLEIPVELGGGVRTLERAKSWLERGVERIVVSTMAYREPDSLRELLSTSGASRVVVAADYKDGEIVTKGWREGEGISIVDAARMFEETGVRNLLTTCVGRDGMAAGPDVETVRSLVSKTSLEIIASGGIRNSDDLSQLERAGAGGAVIGRALYEGGVRLADLDRRTA